MCWSTSSSTVPRYSLLVHTSQTTNCDRASCLARPDERVETTSHKVGNREGVTAPRIMGAPVRTLAVTHRSAAKQAAHLHQQAVPAARTPSTHRLQLPC